MNPIFAMAAIQGGSALTGALIKALSDGSWDPDRTELDEAIGQQPGRDPYGSEAEAASGRITGIANPYVTGSMWDQDQLRGMQQGYLDDLMAVATGDKSYVQEQADQDLAHQESSLLGAAASTRDRFAMGARRAQATQLASAARQNMAAPTKALKAQAFNRWVAQRGLEEGQASEGEGTAAGHYGLGHIDKLYDITRALKGLQADAINES
jgi:hypothetical protein